MVNVFLSGSVTNSSGTVDVESSQPLSANPDRMSATLVNDSSNVVYLALGTSAIANQGIRLNSNGGSYEINSSNLYTGVVSAVTSSGTSSLCLMEMGTK